MFFKKISIIFILVTLITSGFVFQIEAGSENDEDIKYSIDQLCDAVLSNDIPLVKRIIFSETVDINQKDSNGYYPIGIVIPFTNCEMAAILLDAGANPHIIPKMIDTNGETAYDYVMSESKSKYFKKIFREHNKYTK